MAVNSFNALMVGSDDDSIYLGPYSQETADALRQIQALDATLPTSLTDRGWISEDGMSLDHSDSVDKIRGHQGHGVVKSYMSESDTSFKATLLETGLQTLVESMDVSKGKLVGSGADAVAILDVPSSRQTRLLSGAMRAFDTSGSDAEFLILFPMLSLGERASIPFKTAEILGWEYNLEVLGGYRILTNAPGVLEDSARFADLVPEELAFEPVGP